jgi:hypothetical protein
MRNAQGRASECDSKSQTNKFHKKHSHESLGVIQSQSFAIEATKQKDESMSSKTIGLPGTPNRVHERLAARLTKQCIVKRKK